MGTFTASEVEVIVSVRELYRSGAAAEVQVVLGLGDPELAALAGCHPSSVRRYRKGERRPTPAVALRLGRAYATAAVAVERGIM
jgi:hypothetical protein